MTQHIFRRFRLFAIAGLLQLWVAAYGQDAGVTSFEVPAGGTLYEQVTLGKTEMKSISGEVMYSYPLALKPTEGKLPKIKVKVALPKGKTLKSVGTLIVNIPPGGSAPILAQATCANLGVGSAAIQSAAKHDWPYLASLGLAAAEYARKQNPRVKVIFAGFSAGGFAAELATYHDVTRTSGLIQIGSFPMTGNNALPPTCPSVILVGQGDFNLEQASTALQVQSVRGAKIELLTHSGGHSWGTQADQSGAVKTLLAMTAGKRSPGLHVNPDMVSQLLRIKPQDASLAFGYPTDFTMEFVRRRGEVFDWKKALVSKNFPSDFPRATIADASWKLAGCPVSSTYVTIVFHPQGNRVLFDTDPVAVARGDLLKALQLPPVINEEENRGKNHEWQLDFGTYFPDHIVTAREPGVLTQIDFEPRNQPSATWPDENRIIFYIYLNRVKDIALSFPTSTTRSEILKDLGLTESSVVLKALQKQEHFSEGWSCTPKKPSPWFRVIDMEKQAKGWSVFIRSKYG